MKRSEVEKLGESLRARKLSNEEVQSAVDRHWADLQPQANAVSGQVLKDLQSGGSRMPILRWIPAAAAVVLVAGLSVVLWPRTPQATVESGALEKVSGESAKPIHPGERFNFGELIRSNDAGAFTLADGSHVEMRALSKVSLESAEDGARIRLNRGSVIVTAAKQHNGHLYVRTKDVTVSVVGTVFLVNAEEEGSRVAVIQGEVNVKEGDTLTNLHPGQQAVTNAAMEALPVAQELSWSPNALLHIALLLQNTTPPAEPRIRFGAESVKVLPPGGPPSIGGPPLGFGCRGADGIDRSSLVFGGLVVVAQGRCVGYGVPASELIAVAYSTPSLQVAGGPSWARSFGTGFQIDAVADDPSSATVNQLRQMLRTLMADRFMLKFHRESQELPGFALTVAKSGLKMKEGTGPEESPHPDFEQRGAIVVKGRSTLDELARWLTTMLAPPPIVNKTGLAGVYEYEFRVPRLDGGQRGEGQAPGAPPLPADRLALYRDALEEQFGLRMESTKVSFETLVIDSIEMPTPN